MDTPGAGMALVLILLLAGSAYFSASETAISSSNRVRLKTKAESGSRKAGAVLRLADDFDRTLSAILIGNNVVNIASTAIATTVATSLLGPATGPAVSTVVMTVLVLIFGEILPKSFAKENAERVALAVSGSLTWVKRLLTPLVWVFVRLKRLFTGRRSAELNVQPSVTEEELKTIIDTVEEEGVLDRQETDIIHSAIEFDNITVQDILVPRVDMAAVPLTASGSEILQTCLSEGRSRLPVYDGTIDCIVGVLHAKDLLACLARGRQIDAAGLMHPVPFVYRTKHINELLAEFRRTKQQLAIVTDEHGGTLGLVTMEDILEELVGEIWDETDEAETLITRLENGRFLVDGDARLEDLLEAADMDGRQFESGHSTVGGWALGVLGHIPQEGEGFSSGGLHAEVHKMEEQRILSLIVSVPHEGGQRPGRAE